MAGGKRQNTQYIIFKFTRQTNRIAQKLLKTNFTSVASLNENFVSICLLLFISLSFLVLFPLSCGVCRVVSWAFFCSCRFSITHYGGVFCPGSFQLYFFRISFFFSFFENKKWSKRKCQRIKLKIHRQNNINSIMPWIIIGNLCNDENVYKHWTQCTVYSEHAHTMHNKNSNALFFFWHFLFLQ